MTTTDTTPNIMSTTDDTLLDQYQEALTWQRHFQVQAGHIEMELVRRMTERNATAIPSETFIAELEVKNTYDQASLTPLLEIFNAIELEKCYEPAYAKQVEVPARWKTQQVIAAAKRRGAEALAVVDRAKIAGAPRLNFRRRE